MRLLLLHPPLLSPVVWRRSAPLLAAAGHDVAVPVPDGWEPRLCAFLQLGSGYDYHAAEAARRGWRVTRLAGNHLDLLARPGPVADAVLRLLDRVEPGWIGLSPAGFRTETLVRRACGHAG